MAQSLALQLAVPGSDLSYYRLQYFREHYIPIFPEWIIHLRADLGYGDGYGSTEQLPFFQHFYAGGLGTVRGFERNTLGPRATFAEQYDTSSTRFRRDDNGNIVLDVFGNPEPDILSPSAYLLKQVVDENGQPLLDNTGLPVLEEVIDSSSRCPGCRPSPFGGNIQVTGTMELLFPLPFIEDRSRVRSSIFFDAGNVFSSYCSQAQELASNCSKFSLDEIRYSAGVSVSWFSGAFGIMSFSLAKPFRASAVDETEYFQFNLGQTF
jgi:outer membrane protein insertion porin family